MATTLDELRRSVALLIDRDDATEQTAFDATNVDVLNEFINRAERRFYRDEVARIPPFEFRQTHTITGGTNVFAQPAGYLEVRYILATQGERRCTLVRDSVENILNSDSSNRVVIPSRFAYGSNNFYIDPPESEITVDVYYYGQLENLTSLTGPQTSHWLLNNGDDLILYWAAVEAGMYYGGMEQQTQLWDAKALDIRNAIIMQDKRARQSGSTPKSGRAYRTPPQISPNIGTLIS